MSDLRSMQDMFNGTVDGPVNRQPTPLFLADALNADARSAEIKLQAASELRRFYDLNRELTEKGNREVIRNARLEEANKELLEALKLAVDALERSDYIQMDGDSFDVVDVARAAITKHGG